VVGIPDRARAGAVEGRSGDNDVAEMSRLWACDAAVPGRAVSADLRASTDWRASPVVSTSLMLAARLGGEVIPPAAGRPSSSRFARHVLYFISGNLSFTSSIVISFFSRLLRCGRGMLVRSMGSPSAA